MLTTIVSSCWCELVGHLELDQIERRPNSDGVLHLHCQDCSSAVSISLAFRKLLFSDSRSPDVQTRVFDNCMQQGTGASKVLKLYGKSVSS